VNEQTKKLIINTMSCQSVLAYQI